MANDLIDLGSDKAVMPAHLREMYEGRESNVMDVSIAPPSLAITGKVFTWKIGGEEGVMKTKTADGDVVAVQTLPVVILDYAKNRGRSYYAGSYNPGNTAPSDCWSTDGLAPDDAVPEPISPSCANCPNAVKGSRVTDNGTSVTACAQHRILAVIPAKKLDGSLPPLRLKIAQTSDYDGQSKELQKEGWFAFSNFLQALKTRQINFIDAIEVKITFDTNAAWPKLLFQASRWLDKAEAEQVKVLRERPEMSLILGDTAEMPEGGRALPPPKAVASSTTESTEKPKRGRKPKEVNGAAPPPATAAGDASDAVTDMGGDVPVVEEDPDEKAIREAQERLAAKKNANGKGGKPQETKEAAKPEQRKPVENEALSDDAAALLGGWD